MNFGAPTTVCELIVSHSTTYNKIQKLYTTKELKTWIHDPIIGSLYTTKMLIIIET